ncbi:sigma 54-interacting transcriptional regulator [Anabaena sp. CS-542/02]|uniref:sigma 54-interacting transcriptional regulator n=1 Tax=Anabaena sp. CS-542/02 TaxID=3021719 RepID=UPI00232BBA97|nr:sigma 54-interacting transcriptional regulator [Anabaena sp. CS-542/02]MDB9447241.1 sigma 54-interacting transcriptional regulator [Anabaena sp. CS-542/02]
MTSPEIVIWLQERTTLGILTPGVLDAIAQAVEEKVLPAGNTLVSEGTYPQALYILQQGQLQAQTGNQNYSDISLTQNSAIILLRELLLNELTPNTITTVTECHLWVISAIKFRSLVAQYPEITQAFSRLLAQQLAEVKSALLHVQERNLALRPYLVTKAQRGIVGTSRYAVRLRDQIRVAATTNQSVQIFGEPGLDKDNIAALIHYGSPQRREPLIKLNCGMITPSGVDLWGRAGGKPGLIQWLGEGTLVLNNIQELPPELLPSIVKLLETGKYTPVASGGEPHPQPQDCKARVMIIAEKTQPDIQRWVGLTIKVPPLRVRKTDIQKQVEYYTSLYVRARGLTKPQITPEALRRLQSYDFPGNLKELQNIVERAIVQLGDGTELTEELFWSAQTQKKQLRLNLLNAYPGLRKFLRSPWWPNRINYGLTVAAFPVMIAILFLGPQTRDRNLVLNFFWAWWWPFFLFLFPFLGRIWCSVCPFMIYGEITQKISLWLFPRQLKTWPRQKAEKWGGWLMFALFTLIFLWEEIWDLQNTAYLSACLLLLITAGAMIFSAIWERRFWCRYLCPIGGMNGLFAKLSMTELRAQQGICSAGCTTYQCYKGGLQKGEGMETNGCPLYSHPAQLLDNRDCVLCMTCLKACPHRSVEFNLRLPAVELWTTHTPRSYEVALLCLLLGGVYLHRLPELQSWLGLQIDLSIFWQHLGLSVITLMFPTTVVFAAYALMQLTKFGRKPRPFVQLTYGYLPLVLGGNLAHYLRLGLGEAGRILPVSFATFGLEGEKLPILVAHPAVIEFLQGTTLVFSVLFTIILTQKIARQPMAAMFWQHLATLGLAVSMWIIIVGFFS